MIGPHLPNGRRRKCLGSLKVLKREVNYPNHSWLRFDPQELFMRNCFFPFHGPWPRFMATVAAVCAALLSANAADRQSLHGHVPASASPSPSLGRLDPGKRLD